jgi:DNA polymerase (family 10)
LSNAEIADRLLGLAQLLAAQKENPYKVKAYRRAAKTIEDLPESVEDLVRSNADLTAFAGIGTSIAASIRELVQQGTLGQIESLRATVTPEIAALGEHPRLDPARVARIYKTLGIGSVAELKRELETGAIGRQLGGRMEEHVRQALAPTPGMLLYDAHRVAANVVEFLVRKCGAVRAEAVGEYRRRVEVIRELSFVVETDDLPAVLAKVRRHGGLSALPLRVEGAAKREWGIAMVLHTGSEEHLRSLGPLPAGRQSFSTEDAVYRKLGLHCIPPELREGNGEVELAATGRLPVLVSAEDIRGDLHAHSTSSDGANSIEEMAAAARAKGYEYLGITDHSQSLTIARGVSPKDLRAQMRFIDALNGRLRGIQVLKSAEVDILEDGSLDYPDELLKDLDYTVCSIHSKFVLGRTAQTERILRAMDNRYFTVLGHATGRKLLRRPGYEIDVERVLDQARANGCFVEINSNPNRLDFSAAHARRARDAGVKIAVNTDAHSIRELEFIPGGIEQARRAGLENSHVLNCSGIAELRRAFRR